MHPHSQDIVWYKQPTDMNGLSQRTKGVRGQKGWGVRVEVEKQIAITNFDLPKTKRK